jgi:sec1 family domain-containing protein 1
MSFKNLPVTKIVEQLMECKGNTEVDEYLYLDAKLLKGGDMAPKNRSPFQDAIVFLIGGGNYIEYQNLVDFIKVSNDLFFVACLLNFMICLFQQKNTSNTSKRIIYGSSTLNNAKQFLKQLALLGQEIKDSN